MVYHVMRIITSRSNTVLQMEPLVFFLNLFATKKVRLKALTNGRHQIELVVVITDLAIISYRSQINHVYVSLLKKIVLVIINIVGKIKCLHQVKINQFFVFM